MTRLSRALALFVICLPTTAWARYGAEDPRLEELFRTFLSPCCWREELTIHDSPIADQLREQIRSMVRDGQTDEEIKTALVREHTKRILTIPEGRSRALLFWPPWLTAAAGLGGLAFFLRRLSRHTHSPSVTTEPALLSDDEWDIE